MLKITMNDSTPSESAGTLNGDVIRATHTYETGTRRDYEMASTGTVCSTFAIMALWEGRSDAQYTMCNVALHTIQPSPTAFNGISTTEK